MPGWRRSALVVLLLAGAHIAVLWHFMWPGTLHGFVGDQVAFFLPHSAFLNRTLHAGSFPLWNPYTQYGAPEFYWQFHPITLAVHALSPSGIWAYKLYTFLPGLLAGLGAWLFLGFFVRGFLIRLLGALLIQYSPISLVYLINPSFELGYAHVPFLLYFAEGLYRHPSSKWRALGLSFLVAGIVLAASPQVLFYGLLGTCIFFLGRLLLSPVRRGSWVRGALFATFVLLGIGLGAVQLLLLQVVPGQTTEGLRRLFDNPAFFLSGPLKPEDLLGFFSFNLPNVGDPETLLRPFSLVNAFFPWTVLGVLFYIRMRASLRLGLVVGILCALAYFIAFGRENPAYAWLIQRAPWFLRFDNTRRAVLLASVFLPIVAAIGLERLSVQGGWKRDWWSAGLVVACLGLTIWLTEAYRVTGLGDHLPAYGAYGLAATCFLGGSLTREEQRRHTMLSIGALILVIAVPVVARSSLAYAKTSQYVVPQEWLEDNLVLSFLSGDDPYARIHSLAHERSQLHDRTTLAQLPLDLTAYYGLYGVSGGMTMLRHRGADFQNAAADEQGEPQSSIPITRMAGVRWVVSGFVALENPGLRLRGAFRNKDGVAYVYEVMAPLPRAYVPPSVEYVSDGSRLLRKSSEFEPTALALIDVPSTPRRGLLGQSEPSGPGRVRISRYDNERVELRISMDQPGWVILSDTFYPGWRARLDGQPTEIYQANYLFRAVFVPSGEHTVVFRYLPSRLLWGLGIMGASLAFALLFAISHARLPGEWDGDRDGSAAI